MLAVRRVILHWSCSLSSSCMGGLGRREADGALWLSLLEEELPCGLHVTGTHSKDRETGNTPNILPRVNSSVVPCMPYQ